MPRPRTPRLPQPRCGHPTCNRFIRRGETFCLHHRDVGHRSSEREPEVTFIDEDTGNPPFSPDDYRKLLENDLRATLAAATSEMLEQGLIDELGAMRMVLNRLMLEEQDLSKLVSGAARIVTATAQVIRAQLQVVGGDETQAMERTARMIQEVLAALDAERKEKIP